MPTYAEKRSPGGGRQTPLRLRRFSGHNSKEFPLKGWTGRRGRYLDAIGEDMLDGRRKICWKGRGRYNEGEEDMYIGGERKIMLEH